MSRSLLKAMIFPFGFGSVNSMKTLVPRGGLAWVRLLGAKIKKRAAPRKEMTK